MYDVYFIWNFVFNNDIYVKNFFVFEIYKKWRYIDF